MDDTLTMDRRQFLGATAGGPDAGLHAGRRLAPATSQAAATPQPVNTWLTVGTDNSITLTVGATDMGQGSLQGLAQVLAEDLMVDFKRVTLVQGRATLVDARRRSARRSPPSAPASRAATTGACATPPRSRARRWCRRR